MKARFSYFEFDCDQLLLTKSGKVISLNEKPARLLALFLQQPERIFSKDDLLEAVWPNRVITDQVVFQNISHLRAMLGQDAIKTYVKKGYQWQLPVSPLALSTEKEKTSEPNNDAEKDSFSGDISTEKHLASPVEAKSRVTADSDFPPKPEIEQQPKNSLPQFILVGLAIILAVGGYLVSTKRQKADLSKTHLTEIIISRTDNLTKLTTELASNEQMRVSKKAFSTQRLFDSPFSTWQNNTVNQDQLLLATRSYLAQDQTLLRFHIQGAKRGWHGYISGNNQVEAERELKKIIALTQKSNFYNASSEQTALNELNNLFERVPNNQVIAFKLIEMNRQLGYLDRALALADHELTKSNSRVVNGLLHLAKGKLLLRNTQWQQAGPEFEKALENFNQLQLKQLASQASIQQAWFTLHQDNYTEAIDALNHAINFARKAQEPLLEFEAHLTQSSLAAKQGEAHLMASQLKAAELLFDLHALDSEHKVAIRFLQAAISSNPEEKLAHYQSIVEQPYNPYYQQKFYYATRKIHQYFLTKKMWSEASSSLKPWLSESFRAQLNSHREFSQNNFSSAINFAIQSYRQAQIQFELDDALDAALLLLKYDRAGLSVENTQEYIDYIKQQSHHRWLNDNRTQLESLELVEELSQLY